MIFALLLASSHLSSPTQRQVDGAFILNSVPLMRVEVEGKPVYVGLNPSAEQTYFDAAIASEGETRLSFAGQEMTVRSLTADLSGVAADPVTGIRSQGALGRDVLIRFAVGFDPATLRWTVWKGEAPTDELKALMGAPAEATPLFIAKNVVLLPFQYAKTKIDALLDLTTNYDTIPPKVAEKGEAGWLLASKPRETWFNYDGGPKRGDGSMLTVFQGSGSVRAKIPMVGAKSFTDAPFVLDLPAKRLAWPKLTGDRLLTHRLWMLTEHHMSIEGETIRMKEGGYNASGTLKSYVGLEVTSIAGIEAEALIRLVRNADEDATKAFGEAMSSTYVVKLKGKDGATVSFTVRVE